MISLIGGLILLGIFMTQNPDDIDFRYLILGIIFFSLGAMSI